MPTYEYACRECGQHLEVVQSFRDDPLETCGACGGVLRKVFSAAGIIFKGSGYYVTDTRKASSGTSSTTSGDRTKDGKPTTDGKGRSGSSAAGDPGSGTGSGSAAKSSGAEKGSGSGKSGAAESA